MLPSAPPADAAARPSPPPPPTPTPQPPLLLSRPHATAATTTTIPTHPHTKLVRLFWACSAPHPPESVVLTICRLVSLSSCPSSGGSDPLRPGRYIKALPGRGGAQRGASVDFSAGRPCDPSPALNAHPTDMGRR